MPSGWSFRQGAIVRVFGKGNESLCREQIIWRVMHRYIHTNVRHQCIHAKVTYTFTQIYQTNTFRQTLWTKTFTQVLRTNVVMQKFQTETKIHNGQAYRIEFWRTDWWLTQLKLWTFINLCVWSTLPWLSQYYLFYYCPPTSADHFHEEEGSKWTQEDPPIKQPTLRYSPNERFHYCHSSSSFI